MSAFEGKADIAIDGQYHLDPAGAATELTTKANLEPDDFIKTRQPWLGLICCWLNKWNVTSWTAEPAKSEAVHEGPKG